MGTREAKAQAFDWSEGRPQLKLFDFEGVPPAYEDEEGGWYMEQATADRLTLIIAHYYTMPDLFLEWSKLNDRAWQTVLKSTIDVERARSNARITEVATSAEKGWSTWEVAVVVVAGSLVTCGLGILVGVAATSL